MIIVGLADMHGDPGCLEAIAPDLSAADVVVLIGDLTNFGRRDTATRVVNAVRAYNPRVLAVAGNCDYPEVDAYLTAEGINLHRKSVVVNGVALVGVGGSLAGPAPTPNESSEDEFAAFLMEAASGLRPDVPAILVTHQPPYHTAVDRVRGGTHVGSKSIRAFIDKARPLICFTAHIHEARGIDSIGRTTIVNPGPFREGGYAYAEVNRDGAGAGIRGIP